MAVSKIWNGTSWVTFTMKCRNGAAWTAKPKFYNGTAWVDLFTTAGNVVTITGGTETAFRFGANARAEVRFMTTGFVNFRRNGTTNNNVNTTTDWIIPRTNMTLFRVRHTAVTGDTGSATAAGAINVFISLGTVNRSYYVEDSTPTAGGRQAIFTIQIDDGTTVQDTAFYTMDADREDF